MSETAERPTMRNRYARADLPDPEYQRLKRCADRDRRSIASYIRLAVLDRIAADESRAAEGLAGSCEPVVHKRPRPGPK